MHLGNSIICPVTGIPMIVVMGVAAYYSYKKVCSRKYRDKERERNFGMEILKREHSNVDVPDYNTGLNTPFAASLAALVFALQMINFAIPQTGSSGHIIGAVLLSILLGRYLAFISMCIILLVQAVFFADGGLLALGCNIFNMGFIACFVAYPLIYKPLAAKKRIVTASVLASIAALQLGALSVVIEGYISGSISGNIANFFSLMQAVHLPIGIIEGIFTAFVVILAAKYQNSYKLTYTFSGISFLLAGIIAQFASSKPDGLEWTLLNISDSLTLHTEGIIFATAQMLQSKLAVLSNINSVISGILGVLIISFAMILFTKKLDAETVKINEPKI